MSIGKLIKKYREANKLSMQEFADKAGLSKGYISMLEKGVHPQNGKEIIPSIETVSRIAKAMNTSIDALLEQTDKNQPVALKDIGDSIPTPSYEAAAGEGRICDSPTGEVDFRVDPDQVVVTVRGRSMEPTLMDGDQVVVEPTSVVESRHQIYLVRVNGEDGTFKRVEKKGDGLMLIGDNTAEYSPRMFTAEEVRDLPVVIEGVVVKLVRDLR